MLCEVMAQTRLVPGRRVADLCTGSGVVAIKAAALGAASVTAFDVSDAAVRCARANAHASGVDVKVQLGTCSSAIAFAPFDVVVSNPPYVPTPPGVDAEAVPAQAGPAGAFNAGADGRLVLDPLCAAAPQLVGPEGTLLVVQSELSDVEASLALLRRGGLKASVVTRWWIPFGPVLEARAQWLEEVGLLRRDRRTEQLVVIRADAP